MDNDKLDASENVLERCVSDYEKIVIIHVLAKTKGNLSAATKLLGTTRRILTCKVHKYAIDTEQFRL
jgi:DNA-binding NtrC family response regulator